MCETVSFRVRGSRACWTKPFSVIERYSYPVPTPSGIQGLVGAIYAKPEFIWRVHEIRVLNEIQWDRVTTNEIKEFSQCRLKPVPENRTQRSSLILTDVDYAVTVSPLVIAPSAGMQQKHVEILKRRLQRKQYYRWPCLGLSDYPAKDFQIVDDVDELRSYYAGASQDFGQMFHSMNYETRDRRFYHVQMVNGVISVPDLFSQDLHDYAIALEARYRQMAGV